jgi:hypothetical protein
MSYQQEQDRDAIQNIRQAADRARANPKNAEAAKTFARAVSSAWDNGTFQRCATPDDSSSPASASNASDDEEPHCRAKPGKWTKQALSLLERSAKVHQAEAHILYAERGLLLTHAGRIGPAVEELHRSMEMQPNWQAATILIGYYSGQSEYERVKQICRDTTPHIRSTDRKYTFMKRCIDSSGAATQRGGLSWASDQQRTFYRKETRRRRQAEQRRQQRQRQQQRQQKKCKITCKERGHLCLRDCHTDDCEAECNNAYQACLQKCEL